MRGVLRQKEPALLAVLVWFGWILFALVALVVVADLVLLYGDSVWDWMRYFGGGPPPGGGVFPGPPPPKPSGF